MLDLPEEQLGELLSAHLDGELNADELAQVERLLSERARARALLAELRQAAQAVGSLPRESAPAGLLDEIRAEAERRSKPPEAIASTSKGRRRPVWLAPMSMAATLAIAATGLWLMVRDDAKTGVNYKLAVAPSEGDQQVPSPFVSDFAASKSLAKHRLTEPSTSVGVANKGKKEGKRGAGFGNGAAPELRRGQSLALADKVDQPLAVASTATIEDQFRTGEPIGVIQSNSFSNELMRLRVIVPDARSRDAIVDSLDAQLAAGQLTNLAEREPIEGWEVVRERGYYLNGQAGVNFADPAENQIVVNTAAVHINRLVASIAEQSADASDVTLCVGPVVIKGWENSQATLRGFERPIDRSRSEERAAPSEALAPVNVISVLVKTVTGIDTAPPERSRLEEAGEQVDRNRSAGAAGGANEAEKDRANEPLDEDAAADDAAVTGGSNPSSTADNESGKGRAQQGAEKASAQQHPARPAQRQSLTERRLAELKRAIESKRKRGKQDRYDAGPPASDGGLVTLVLEFVVLPSDHASPSTPTHVTTSPIRTRSKSTKPTPKPKPKSGSVKQ